MNNSLISNINNWPGLKTKQNIFSKEVLDLIKLKISKANFKEIYQEKNGHYSHVFKSLSERVTKEGETYISNYYQASDSETINFLIRFQNLLYQD